MLPSLGDPARIPYAHIRRFSDLGAPLELPTQFTSTPAATAAEGAPHVVVFMVDDLGFGDVSFMQSDVEAAANLDTVAATPALNAMASKGIRLTSFYTSPTCTPSRASFMTGKYTTNLGLQVGRGGGSSTVRLRNMVGLSLFCGPLLLPCFPPAFCVTTRRLAVHGCFYIFSSL